MKKIVYYHILPLVSAIILSYFLLKFNFNSSLKPRKTLLISGIANKEKFIPAVGSDLKNQLALVESLSDKNAVTVFGSSELTTETPYITYNFLPDSLDISCRAFGHAHFQSFAIYCQLLGMKEYVQNSKICVILSPGWFESDGTNIEAFIEHIRPELLKRIIWDPSISFFQKKRIGSYLNTKTEQIDFPSLEIEYLKLLASRKTFLQPYELNFLKKNFNNYKYAIKPVSQRKHDVKTKVFDWERNFIKVKSLFFENSKNNPYNISDAYFNKHIKSLDKFQMKEYQPLKLESNTELNDLLILIRFLKKEKVKPVFIVQGLNPYYYKNLHKFNPILKLIKAECNKQGFPILNMFSDNKIDYEPGILNDVMHMGDYGWLKVNRFLKQSFYE